MTAAAIVDPSQAPPLEEAEITAILAHWGNGDAGALERLMPLVYQALRRKAHHYLEDERRCFTLQPTALVNEVYLRLLQDNGLKLENRAHFFYMAGRLMRRILVDHARARLTEKRGEGRQNLALEDVDEPALTAPDPAVLLALDKALKNLEKLDPRRCRIVEMRYFGGLSHEEIGSVLNITDRTVKREWRTARLWLAREVGGGLS